MNAQKPARINKYDNLKGLAIILIVLGHMPGLLSPAYDHRFIYIIHLPIFFFVAGYFSKIGPDEPVKAFKRLFIPYVVFCILWKIFLVYVIGQDGGTLFINPGMALWFLLALFIMKLLLSIMDRLRYPILISFILALLIGMLDIPGDLLAITRVFVYMPIFLIGFYYNTLTEKFNLNKIWNNKKLLIVLLAITTVACIVAAYTVPAKMILLQHPYKNSFLKNMFFRFVVMILGIIFVLILNNLMTNKEMFLTKIGKNSMAVYLIHPYFVKFFIKPYIIANFSKGLIGSIVIISVTLILTFILSRDVVTKYLNKFLDTISNILIIN